MQALETSRIYHYFTRETFQQLSTIEDKKTLVFKKRWEYNVQVPQVVHFFNAVREWRRGFKPLERGKGKDVRVSKV